ncbi:molybdenum cofactor biosynthesis protein C [Sphaeroforma arctica JP610]|uniref:cyclic pyranopterin monophosphate synthase n=1 Tax=Sphaeroforma arctica JP610 TaxID=667725 RepID=A0A0L0FEW4_9EUKA|nr:molybdenum cofactor biosynthesis protein C [Sphaeroforma arctica JP610]KNC74578.1 molybdenum cofactor biosynthesis protein C [Sphaeroforma arctica JP610]|eukprot:XP_014148480.1 molybdenum cofactor biosynthesis protein C [Sphaeroforma arctica JP610]
MSGIRTGKATMVDVTDKAESTRTAAAQAIVQLSEATFKRVSDNTMRKGDVLTVAQLAGIMGAKRTSELIPLCHPLFLSKVSVDLHLLPLENSIRIQSEVRTKGSTGVEMEALTAVSVASLCVYDMCKSIGHEITITDTKLVSKTGGKSDFST